jgi:hypothetical protein
MDYSNEFAERVYNHIAKHDHSVSEICQQTGCTLTEFRAFKKDNPEFAALIKEAEDERLQNRVSIVMRGQRKLLEGWLSTEETILYDKDDNEIGRKIVRKWVPPSAQIVAMTLRALDVRYRNPEIFDKPATPGGIDKPITNLPAVPNIFINIPTGAKSLNGAKHLNNGREN